ncbi:hypothetical protein P872_06260 [Rhodonellum psychrophilum GCM71 = DSM 17998]|uniref:Cellulase Ig-like domain-containing protein n=2 Tax=Rhodonellum TaxID=336827 RepID=U5BZS9_9BACT|nr:MULTISPECIES: hypothetical protein [Rhodonellum]ERM83074.1 hypothetical protein P872_06260 [Rhodonellum psychrophilum GCM71 = DSM 17998]SDZ47114.1 hypothetical protein SAMN05444412_11619 [Rhodonellum ikkaensis]
MKNFILTSCLFLFVIQVQAFTPDNKFSEKTEYNLTLKKPGNPSQTFRIQLDGSGKFQSNANIPLEIEVQLEEGSQFTDVVVKISAKKQVFFNFSSKIHLSDISYEPSQILMPGYWYRKNLRSPENAPSVRESTDWLVREDRLSSPLVSVFDPKKKFGYSLLRLDEINNSALTTHENGEVILSGTNDLGALGFGKEGNETYLEYAFPYAERPYTYIRKLTLAEPVIAFAKLEAGESRILRYRFQKHTQNDFSDFVADIWHHSYQMLKPTEVEDQKFTDHEIKTVLTSYFKSSFVDFGELKGFSGVHLETALCESTGILEVGFIGRVLLNAFNALEFAEANNDLELMGMARSVFQSYKSNGFNENGLIREVIDFNKKTETDVYSIRRQSEGLYALLLFIKYEKEKGRKHPDLEVKIKNLFNRLITLQYPDGSFPRKFDKNLKVIDETGGSSPSFVLPLAMAQHYFKDKKYLEIARKVARYQEEAIIGPSDYFSSTLDADCEDKEASLYAATAMYYLAQITKGKEREHYKNLAKKAAYFTLSWYYTWDVPFAQGQMLGDIGLKSRGWGNVSVENNHIDVFIFEFDEVLDWLAVETNEPEFAAFAGVIRSSMREQLLPHEGNLMGVAKVGYYPEVVQHTAWDYGKNGKGFYNDLFAPGWTVASIWELLTIGRTSGYFK